MLGGPFGLDFFIYMKQKEWKLNFTKEMSHLLAPILQNECGTQKPNSPIVAPSTRDHPLLPPAGSPAALATGSGYPAAGRGRSGERTARSSGTPSGTPEAVGHCNRTTAWRSWRIDPPPGWCLKSTEKNGCNQHVQQQGPFLAKGNFLCMGQGDVTMGEVRKKS